MNLAKVCGTVVSSSRGDEILNARFLMIEGCTPAGKCLGDFLVALDLVDARPGDVVLVAQGSSCRWTFATEGQPVDTLIVGIVDSIDSRGENLYHG